MITTKKAPKKLNIAPPLSDGKHKVQIHSITERAGQLAIKLVNNKGYYWMYKDLTPTAELYSFLGELAHLGGLDYDRTHSVNSLIGLHYQITIINQQISEINETSQQRYSLGI